MIPIKVFKFLLVNQSMNPFLSLAEVCLICSTEVWKPVAYVVFVNYTYNNYLRRNGYWHVCKETFKNAPICTSAFLSACQIVTSR
jgi:hypothetical protein